MPLIIETSYSFGQTEYNVETHKLVLGNCGASTYGTIVQRVPVSALVFNVAVSFKVLLMNSRCNY